MMRYAQSGHKSRTAEIDDKRLQRVATPHARARVAVVLVAAVAPAVLAMVLSSRTRLVVEETVSKSAAVVAPVVAKVTQRAAPPAPVPPPPPPAPVDTTEHDKLQDGEALSQALARHHVRADDVSDLVRDLKGSLDVRSLRAGARFSVKKDGEVLSRFAFAALSPDGVPRTITAMRLADADAAPAIAGDVVDDKKQPRKPRYDVLVEDAVVETKVEGLVGSIKGSLYNGILDAGGDANLVNKFVDVFAWNIDFYRQTQTGDEFKVIVEKKYAGEGEERRFLGYGKVLAAEYVNAGTEFTGINFETKDGKFGGFFDESGDSLQRTFLKNPMEVSRVTSSFGMRFHPVLGRNKKHEGVDYGAAIGTPVWSVADGVVVEARYSKTAGNMILVQHMNGISTEYFHLSRFAEGLKQGARVKQKQLIGFVGTTGMSTGPHLHFGMLKSGAHVDPGAQKFPNAKPIPAEYKGEFETTVTPLLAQLQALTRA